MREIKFRAWDTSFGEPRMVSYEDLLLYDNLKPSSLVIPLRYGDKFTLMQYTGLKDKNGVEIYEGDIVRQKTGRAYTEDRVVRFDAGAFRFQDQLTKHGCYIYTNQNTEVIGNIYKNKDLL